MSRFLVPPEQIRGGRFTLTGPEAHHARNVLRKKPGDEIELFDGKDASFTGRIDAVEEEGIQGVILATVKQTISFRLTLGQAILKGPKWDWLVEKACEVGMAEILPLITERSLIPLAEASRPEKLERWNRIAVAASKQCGRANVMRVMTPVVLDDALRSLKSETLSLIPWEKETAVSIASACVGSTAVCGQLFIGPEGGWSSAEIDRAVARGARPVKLGPTLLRSETAGIVSAALMFREFNVY